MREAEFADGQPVLLTHCAIPLAAGRWAPTFFGLGNALRSYEK